MPFVKFSEVKEGDTLIADDGFTCMDAGPKTVMRGDNGLYVECMVRKHYLAGQEDETGCLVGFTKPKEGSNV